MRELKVWRIDDGERHYVIANDVTDAAVVMFEYNMAADYADVSAYLASSEPRIVSMDDIAPLTVRNDDGDPAETLTCAEWVAREGRVYLAGTCF